MKTVCGTVFMQAGRKVINMSFSGLKSLVKKAEEEQQKRLAEQAAALQRAVEEEALNVVEKSAERAIEIAATGCTTVPIMVLKKDHDFEVPSIRGGGPYPGITTRYEPLTFDKLRSTAKRVYELLEERRDSMPEDERFEIVLSAHPLGFGGTGDWVASMSIKI